MAVGEPLVELETEKIDLEVSAERAGVLASIKRQEGDDVKIGEVLAVVDEIGAAAAAQPAATAAAEPRPQPAPAAAAAAPRPTSRATPTAAHGEGPRRRPRRVQGSARRPRVMKQDVQAAMAPAARQAPARGAAPAPAAAPAPPRQPQPPPSRAARRAGDRGEDARSA